MTIHPTTELLQTLDDPTGGGWAWTPQPEAQRLVDELMLVFLERCPDSAAFGERIINETGTHITDWIGVILTPDTPETRRRLEQAGYTPRVTEFVDADIHYAFEQKQGVFPDILLTDSDRMSVGLRVESIADFFAVNQLSGFDSIQGEPLARARWAPVYTGERAALWVMERHGYNGYHLAFEPAEHRIAATHHFERFRTRARCFHNGCDGLEDAERAAAAAADELGEHWAADFFMRAEREYFARAHAAAGAQDARQRALGFGWKNMDHLVYAASRARLPRTLDVFARLGFAQRESFDLGPRDAARVLAQPVTGDVVVVVSPSTDQPGNSGSFVTLLGESLLAPGPAGMAVRGDTDTLREHLGLHTPGPCALDPRPIADESIESLAADGRLDEGLATSLRNGARIGPVFCAVSRRAGDAGLNPDLLAWRVPGA